jgi:glycine cleavage system H protein
VEVRFHTDHTWVRVTGDMATIGITEYAQKDLGEVSYIDLPEEGDELCVGEEFGLIESSTTTFELIAPVSGEVFEINEALNDDPSIINKSPYIDGWMVKVEVSDSSELEDLMTEEKYEEFVSED